jgi:DNA adenine methylase
VIPALLKWVGNKQRVASIIVDQMPKQFNTYYEPFLGSGAILGELLFRQSEQQTPQFVNAKASDVLPFLIDIFNITKNEPNKLISYYEEIIREYNRNPDEQYRIIKERFNKDHNPLDFVYYLVLATLE